MELILSVLDHHLFYSNKHLIVEKYLKLDYEATIRYLPTDKKVWEKLYLDIKHVELHQEIDQNYTLGML